MSQEVKTGMTDYTVTVFIPDSASTDGSGKTGLVAANLTVSGVRVETDNDVTVIDYTGSLNNLAALTTAHTDWGLFEISSTLAPGLYRLDIADAIFATGAWSAVVYVMVTTSAAVATPIEFILVPQSPVDGVLLAPTTHTSAVIPTVTTLTGNTAQTGDNFARLGAPAGASVSADVAAIKAETAAILVDTGTDIPASISGIGTAGGAAVNVDAATDNSAGGITGVTSGTTKVGTETGTYTNTSILDGTYHLITHAANAIDWVYQFLTGGGTNPVEVKWSGYLDGSNDSITFYAWNHVGAAWEAIGVQAGQPGTVNVVKAMVLYARHRGTSAAELGKIYIRIACTAQSAPILRTDQLYISYAVTSRSVGYANGSVWVDTVSGTAGTESFVHGVADLPVLTMADALTIATNNKLRVFEIENGSTVTLAAATTNKVFNGHEWTLALGGQDISSSMFIDAAISGTSTGTAAEFETCEISTMTVYASNFHDCSFNATLTLGAAGDYMFANCYSHVAGTGSPVFDFTGAGTKTASFRGWSGGITLSGITSGTTASIDVVSGGTVTLNGADGNVQVRGMCNIVDNRTGTPTLGRDNNMDYRLDNIDAALTVIDDFLDTEVAAIKAKTDSLTFTKALELDTNIQSVNGVTVNGDGAGTPMGV